MILVFKDIHVNYFYFGPNDPLISKLRKYTHNKKYAVDSTRQQDHNGDEQSLTVEVLFLAEQGIVCSGQIIERLRKVHERQQKEEDDNR